MAETPYRIVIGLEIHVQLLTRSKLFCGCSTQFGLPPNSATCPVCIGMPGVLPVMNRRAFELAVKAALALNCRIAPFTKWDRKNYFYPDLPKNYQISQYDLPFSHDGWLEVPAGADPAGAGGGAGESRRIGIIRVHLEEDAGKMLHDESGGRGQSQVDLNRAGTPLLEIVSRPDLTSPEEARAYLEEIRLLLRELEISDCEMQEGSLRCDANVNIHVPIAGSSPLAYAATPLVEVKNLNSFRAVERALRYEAQRQYDDYQRLLGQQWQLADTAKRQVFAAEERLTHAVMERKDGQLCPVGKATAGWDEDRGRTLVQRRKEEASDYRYFPEPDLAPVTVADDWLEQVRAELGELPAAQRVRLVADHALSEYDAGVICRQGRKFVAYFEEVARLSGDPKSASNWVTNQVLATLNERKRTIADFPLSAAALADLIRQVQATGLNMQRAREVYAEMLASGAGAEAAIQKLGLKVVADTDQLRALIRQAMADNPRAVADFKKGKTRAADALKGAVMRATRGMARTELVQQLLMEELEQQPG